MKQAGFSLIEMLLTCFLGALLLSIMAEIFVNNQQTNRAQSALLELQENAQFAEKILSAAIMPAGLMLCGPLSTTALPAFSIQDNVITVRKINSSVTNIKSILNPDKIVVNNINPHYKSNDTILVTNCIHANILSILSVKNSVDTQTLQVAKQAIPNFSLGALVGLWQQDRFYLAKSRVKNSYALYQEDTHHQKNELITDVMDWSIEGLIQQHWELASHISRWNEVNAIKIHLLLRSQQPIFKHPEQYYFCGKLIRAKDNYLYREFTFFIPINIST